MSEDKDSVTISSDQRLIDELHESLRSGFLFGHSDEPIDAYGKRLVRVILSALEAIHGPQGSLGPTSYPDRSQKWKEIWDLFHEIWGCSRDKIYYKGKFQYLQGKLQAIERGTATLESKQLILAILSQALQLVHFIYEFRKEEAYERVSSIEKAIKEIEAL